MYNIWKHFQKKENKIFPRHFYLLLILEMEEIVIKDHNRNIVDFTGGEWISSNRNEPRDRHGYLLSMKPIHTL